MYIVAISLLLTVQMANAPQSDDPEDYVLTFQVRPDAKATTVDLLAKVSEVRETQIPNWMTLEQVTFAEYGTTYKILAEVKERNRGKPALLPAGATVKLPGAPEWRFNQEVTIPKNLSVKSFACIAMGVCGPSTLRDIEVLNRAPLGVLKKRGTVVLPFTAPVVSVRLNKAFKGRINEIVARLRADPAVERVEITKPFELVPGMEDAMLSSGVCTTGGGAPAASPTPTLSWITSLKPAKRPTIVAVLDSGIARDDKRFNFWQNAREKAGAAQKDDDQNHLTDDIIGTDVLHASKGGGFPLDDLELPAYRNHGTHVAGISSGRTYADAERTKIDERLQLMILKVADKNGKVWPGAAADGVSYALMNGANVINMSFAGDFSIATQWAMKQAPRALFVTAAGNSLTAPIDLSTTRLYPAGFASELPNVIAVAASDATSKLACFSNFGTTVDVAAPGVRVQSTIKTGTGVLSGTSQATPWVTFAAALLYSMDVCEPALIRERILNTVDFRRELIGKVRSEGTLNIEKAVAFSDDLVVRTDGQVIRGAINGPSSFTTSCAAGSHKMADVRRIVFDAAAPTAERTRLKSAVLTDLCVTQEPFAKLAFVEKGTTVVTQIPVSSLREIVPRLTTSGCAP